MGSSDIKTTGLEHVQAIIDGRVVVPMHETLGFKFREAAEGRVVLTMEPDLSIHGNSLNMTHGGTAASLLNSAMGFAGLTGLPEGKINVPLKYTIDLIRPITSQTGLVRTVGKLTQAGTTKIFSKAHLLDREGRVLAKGSGTYAIRDSSELSYDSSGPRFSPHSHVEIVRADTAQEERAYSEPVQTMVDGKRAIPLHDSLRFEFERATDGQALITVTPDLGRHGNSLGRIHDGVASALIDSAAGFAILANLPEGKFNSVISFDVHVFNALPSAETLQAVGWVDQINDDDAASGAEILDQNSNVLVRGSATSTVRTLSPDFFGGE